MPTILKPAPFALCLLAAAMLACVPRSVQAQASGLTFTITGPGTITPPSTNPTDQSAIPGVVTISGAAGSTLTFVGSISNNTGFDLTMLSAAADSNDPTNYTALNFTPSPISGLLSGQSENSDLFTLTFPSSAAPGETYSFDASVVGQDANFDGYASDDTYTVNATVSPAPEPSGLWVLAAGGLLTAGLRLRRRA